MCVDQQRQICENESETKKRCEHKQNNCTCFIFACDYLLFRAKCSFVFSSSPWTQIFIVMKNGTHEQRNSTTEDHCRLFLCSRFFSVPDLHIFLRFTFIFCLFFKLIMVYDIGKKPIDYSSINPNNSVQSSMEIRVHSKQ